MLNFLLFSDKTKSNNFIKNFLYRHIVLNRLNLGTSLKKLNTNNNFFLDFIRFKNSFISLNKIVFYLKKALSFVEDVSFLGFNIGLANGIFFQLMDLNYKYYNKRTLINLFMFLNKEGLIIYGNDFFQGALLNNPNLNTFSKKSSSKFFYWNRGKYYYNPVKLTTRDVLLADDYLKHEINFKKKYYSSKHNLYSFLKYKDKKIKHIFFPKSFIILNKDFFLLKQCYSLNLIPIYLNDTDESIVFQSFYFPGNVKSFLSRRFSSFLFVQSFLLGRLKRYIFIQDMFVETVENHNKEMYDEQYRYIVYKKQRRVI